MAIPIKLTATLAVIVMHRVGALPTAIYQPCGFANYDPTAYTCYDGNQLCPINGGDVTNLCGRDCYSTKMYTCNADVLQALPAQQGLFSLIASNPGKPVDGLPINFAGQRVHVGGQAAAYRPSQYPRACGLNGTQSIFYSPTALAVTVPGGQAVFVQNDGTLAFTQAHSAYMPNALVGRSQDLKAFSVGAFIGPGGADWKACPQSKSRVWTMHANIPEANLPSNCIQFTALVMAYTGALTGAWQYT